MGAAGSRDLRKYPEETLCDHGGGINCMAASDDESLLVTGSEDKTARVWCVGEDDTECLGVIRGHTSYVTCVTVHDTFVITGSADSTLRKWDIITCDCLFTYHGHKSRVTRVLCTGEYVLSTSQDTTAKAWYIDEDDLEEHDETSVCVRTFEGHTGGIYCQVIIPGEDEINEVMGLGDVIITGSMDCTARSWCFTSGKCLKKFEGHASCVSCLTTDTTGRILYTGSADKTLRSWDLATGVCFRVFAGHHDHVVCLVVLKQLLYSGDGGGVVKGWEVGADDQVAKNLHQHKTLTVEALYTFTGHRNTVNCIKFHKGILYTGCSDNMTRAFDATSKQLLAVYVGHKIGVNCLMMCGSKLFSGSTDTTIMVWDLAKRSAELDDLESSDDDDDDDDDDNGNKDSNAK